ncbi:hypothetical protein Purlil1_7715 [Purpureocillium lilacinum]|uniref:Uncharacterized protein n=1 Tax=Purpureocillium lilacinum TaxID=33203 RepID=A0ABR0BVR1_PURLI|nr:hypothetical protein Purlil1_7715 [Purpureocillium lilacinum]
MPTHFTRERTAHPTVTWLAQGRASAGAADMLARAATAPSPASQPPSMPSRPSPEAALSAFQSTRPQHHRTFHPHRWLGILSGACARRRNGSRGTTVPGVPPAPTGPPPVPTAEPVEARVREAPPPAPPPTYTQRTFLGAIFQR